MNELVNECNERKNEVGKLILLYLFGFETNSQKPV